MNDGKIIIDKIIAEAEKVAEATLKQAQKEVDSILKAGRDKAEKEADTLERNAQAEAEKVKSKEISGAEMQAKKAILEQKQTILADVIAEADKSLGTEIIVSPKDVARLAATVKENGFDLSEKTADISGGFIVKNGDIEYNYSFESIITVEKEAIRQTAAQILF